MITKSGKYAIRALLFLSTVDKNKNAGIKEITEAIDSPPHYSSKILQVLSRKKIVSSQKGPNGGFHLSPQQKKINLYNVLIALDEIKAFNECVLGLNECDPAAPCPVHSGYEEIREKLNLLFRNTRIEDLSEDLLNKNVFLKH